MNNQNTKVYLAISGALIFLFILILVIPFSNKKISPQKTTTPSSNQPFPTTVETNSGSQSNNNFQNNSVPADFTGVAEEKLPAQVLDTSLQKKDLRQKTPLGLSTFIIDFDYAEDEFIVTLKDPKDQARKEFEGWRTSNYPGLGIEQFLIR